MSKSRFFRTKSALMASILIGAVLLGFGPNPVKALDTPQEAEHSPEGRQIVLSLEEGTDIDYLSADFGAKVVRRGPLNFGTLEFPENRDIKKEIQELKNTPGVISAEENHSHSVASSAKTTALTDPLYEQQWPLIDQGVAKAWEQGATGQGVTIAFVDTGIALEHPDLKNNLVPGYNAITESTAAGANQDNNGHGTEVAGVAAAEQNTVGIAGVAHQAKIMPVKAIGANGVGYDDDIAAGIIWAADHGARIINLSLGSENGPAASEILKRSVTYAYDKGCLLVAASGNYDQDRQENPGVSYPASDQRVLAVTATDQEGKITSYSAVGPEVNLAAPGDNILTDGWSQLEGVGYTYASGTSLAAPFVSGEAALIWSQHPEWSRDQVIEALEQGTEDLGSAGLDDQYGYGLVNLELALNLVTRPLVKMPSPARIDELGGVLEWSEGSTRLELTIPQQAFKEAVNAAVNTVSPPDNLPNGAEFLTAAVQVDWGNVAPQKMLSLAWKDSRLQGDGQESLYRWDGRRWLALGGEISDGEAGLGLYQPGIYVIGTAQPLEQENNRFAGVTAEETAVQISQATFPTGADTVILAQVNQFPDALAGAPLAYKLQAPILLSQSSELTQEVREELQRLAPKTVYLLGGTAALSARIETELRQTYEVKRLFGYTAAGTARAIALELGTQGKAVIAGGSSFQDALVISAWAARQGIPILLSQPGILSEDTQIALRELKVTTSLVIGGTAVVSDKVMDRLPLPTRISGTTAYETAAAVLEKYPPATAKLQIATGENFPDALTGAVRAAFSGSRVVLVPTHSPIPAGLSSLLSSWQGKQVEVLGGVSVVPESVVRTVQTWVQ